MYLPIPTQSDCASAWREAVRLVDKSRGHEAYNVIIDVATPRMNADRTHPGIAIVDEFLSKRAKSVETVANTIFPESLYRRHGAPDLFKVFHERVLPKVRRNDRWSGYYFERMTALPVAKGEAPNPLWEIVQRLRDHKVRALNKFELSVFEPNRDVDKSPYGGQCLSFLSFKILPGATKALTLTAMYRNHFYVEKLLGNLMGLSRLMGFVAEEAGIEVGPLTVVSTHAQIDLPAGVHRSQLQELLYRFDQATAAFAA